MYAFGCGWVNRIIQDVNCLELLKFVSKLNFGATRTRQAKVEIFVYDVICLYT